jgi:hypothetical protein
MSAETDPRLTSYAEGQSVAREDALDLIVSALYAAVGLLSGDEPEAVSKAFLMGCLIVLGPTEGEVADAMKRHRLMVETDDV